MPIEFINSKYKFSLYPNLLTVDQPIYNIDVNQLIEIIKFGYIKDEIQLARNSADKEEYSLHKKENIPCVTLSGIFKHRDRKGLIKHSGLIQVDIDKVENYDILFQNIVKDPFVYLCFRSPGAKGIKVGIKINPSADTHVNQFKALENYFKEHFKIDIDSQCKDISRCMLLSFDPDIYCNPNSSIFEEVYMPEIKPITISNGINKNTYYKKEYSDETNNLIESIIYQLEAGKIDITSTYSNWIKVGFSLCTTFGEGGRSYYHRIGAMYPYYTPEETDRIYSQLLIKNNGKTRLGTIIYLAKQSGLKIKKSNMKL